MQTCKERYTSSWSKFAYVSENRERETSLSLEQICLAFQGSKDNVSLIKRRMGWFASSSLLSGQHFPIPRFFFKATHCLATLSPNCIFWWDLQFRKSVLYCYSPYWYCCDRLSFFWPWSFMSFANIYDTGMHFLIQVGYNPQVPPSLWLDEMWNKATTSSDLDFNHCQVTSELKKKKLLYNFLLHVHE